MGFIKHVGGDLAGFFGGGSIGTVAGGLAGAGVGIIGGVPGAVVGGITGVVVGGIGGSVLGAAKFNKMYDDSFSANHSSHGSGVGHVLTDVAGVFGGSSILGYAGRLAGTALKAGTAGDVIGSIAGIVIGGIMADHLYNASHKVKSQAAPSESQVLPVIPDKAQLMGLPVASFNTPELWGSTLPQSNQG